MEYEDIVASNPTTVKERIDEALQSLSNLSSSTRSRTEILSDLANDLSEYYGYIHELAEFLLDLFPPAECVEYMEASDRPRPLVIRTNTLKSSRKDLIEALNKRGASVEAVDWSKVAIKVTESSVPIGATPEYLAGHYMLQSAASLNPVMALAPVPGEKVLDMSAAPGGKTTYIAQLMKNSGTLIANDLKPQRQKATVANLHRLGVKNTVVCCYDGRKIGTNIKGFDRVLLDAPCSGLGVISRDQSVKVQRTVKDIQRISHLQKELLRAAVDAVDPNSPTGGIIVYSTCSISTEENEQVVDFILKRRFVKLIETGLEVGKPGFTRHKERRFHPSLALTRRFYPHVHNMDGFYVAKFKKYKNGVRGDTEDDEEEGVDNSDSEASGDSEGDSEGEEEEEEEDVVSEGEDSDDDEQSYDSAQEGSDVEEEEEEDEEDEESEEEEVPVPIKASKKGEVKSTPAAKNATPAKTPAKATPAMEKKSDVKATKTPKASTPAPVVPTPATSSKKQKVATPAPAEPVWEPRDPDSDEEEEEEEDDDEEGEESYFQNLVNMGLKRRRSAAPPKRKSIKALREIMQMRKSL